MSETDRKDPKQARRDLRNVATVMNELNQTESLISATSEEETDKKYLAELKLKKKAKLKNLKKEAKEHGTPTVLDTTMDDSTELNSTPKKINDTSEVMDAPMKETKSDGITTPKPPTAPKLQAEDFVKEFQDKIEAKEQKYEHTKALCKGVQEELEQARTDGAYAEDAVEMYSLKLTATAAELEATVAANEFKAAMKAMTEYTKEIQLELKKKEKLENFEEKLENFKNNKLHPTDDKCGGHNTTEGRKNRNAAFVERVKFFPPNEKKEKESKESNAMNVDTTFVDTTLVEEDTISFPWDYKNTSSSSYACSTKVEQQESTYESVESNDAPKEAIYDNVEIHKLTKDKNDQDKVHNKEYEIRGGMPTRDNDDYNCHGLPKSKVHEKDAYAIYGEQKRKVHEDKIHGEQKDKKLNQEICDNVDGLQHHELRKEKEKKKAIEHNLLAKETDVKSEYLNDNCIGAHDTK